MQRKRYKGCKWDANAYIFYGGLKKQTNNETVCWPKDRLCTRTFCSACFLQWLFALLQKWHFLAYCSKWHPLNLTEKGATISSLSQFWIPNKEVKCLCFHKHHSGFCEIVTMFSIFFLINEFNYCFGFWSFQVSPQTRRRARASLSDLSSLRDIEDLSVRQLKEILARNFVNYSGCCEKWELVERVSRLYRETEENRKSSGYTLGISGSVLCLCMLVMCYCEILKWICETEK